ncbi:MAG: site-specific DNA-methyltransferase [Chloroflexota bacterium]|nr:site-specific DNA-methyltransferase [Chloroflexota bacterium]
MIPTNTVLCGDALATLKSLPDACVQMVCTSPPYWHVRDYQTPGQLGLEPSFEEYVATLCDVFDEVKRVIRPDGTAWVNLADSYSGSNGGMPSPLAVKSHRFSYTLPPRPRTNIPRKSLCLIPYRFAIEMVRRGWRLRNVLVWHKPNAVPESVKDRFTIDFEYLFFFSKSRHYYFEQQFEPATDRGIRRGRDYVRNKRSVWTIPTKGFAGNHFAVYPEALVETPIRACCPKGGTVLDPFLGTGTTAVTAKRLGRRWMGIELNPAYVQLARERLDGG